MPIISLRIPFADAHPRLPPRPPRSSDRPLLVCGAYQEFLLETPTDGDDGCRWPRLRCPVDLRVATSLRRRLDVDDRADGLRDSARPRARSVRRQHLDVESDRQTLRRDTARDDKRRGHPVGAETPTSGP